MRGEGGKGKGDGVDKTKGKRECILEILAELFPLQVWWEEGRDEWMERRGKGAILCEVLHDLTKLSNDRAILCLRRGQGPTAHSSKT